ncbi:MAG: serine O-acetyltransferase EpsC [Eubacteriales bacterium]
MDLKDWLNKNSKEVSSVLADENRKSLLGNKVLNYTTRAQIIDILKELRSLILPGVYDNQPIDDSELNTVIEDKMKVASSNLFKIIKSILVHECVKFKSQEDCIKMAEQLTIKTFEGLIEVRKTLDSDIKAAYEGDPAAKSFEEIILSYPSLEAISIFRIAHLIATLNIPIIPRIMTEYAHTITGIDIHPNATIGNSFFIDHGTGVVIGETCTIGNNVKLYQGVTLGAKSFPLDEHGRPIKGIKRHPDIRDNVIIYSGATILGNIEIGHHSVIGGNVWLTKSIPPHSSVFNTQPEPFIKQKTNNV